MSYIYKQDFGKCFDDMPLPQNEGTISHPLIELDEVYAKAEAFDEIVQSYEDNTGLGEMDEDLCDCVTFIEETGDIIGRYESEELE